MLSEPVKTDVYLKEKSSRLTRHLQRRANDDEAYAKTNRGSMQILKPV